ncbi:MAG: LysR substrate-binding domain-containing protein, partial [Rhodoglobus sp.]
DGLVDIAVTFAYTGDRADPHREGDGSFDSIPLFTEPVVIALSESHRLATGDAIELALLGDDRWIAGCPLCRGHLLAACEAVGVTPQIELETDNAIAVLNLVARDLGVALLPQLALATAPIPPGAAVRSTVPSSDRSIQVVVKAGSSRVPSIAAALEVITGLDGDDWGLERAR